MARTSAPKAQSTRELILEHIERLERLGREKDSIVSTIREAFQKAKDAGLDLPTLKDMLKLRRMTPTQRVAQEQMRQLYRGALGMLDGTPLGMAALQRLQDTAEVPAGHAPPRFVEDVADVDIAGAEGQGRSDATKGKPISDNPFPANDPRRAAYDQGWCAAAGVTPEGELPLAFRRTAAEEDQENEEPESGADEAEALLQGGEKPKRGRGGGRRKKDAEPDAGAGDEGDQEAAPRVH